MTNICKDKVDSENYTLAYKHLLLVISKLEKNTASFLFDELLTESEKIMVVKRFAAVFMFQQNYTSYRVSNLLAMSLSTTHRLYKLYCSGNFNNILSCISPKQKSEFISIIEDFILSKGSGRARSRLLNRALKRR